MLTLVNKQAVVLFKTKEHQANHPWAARSLKGGWRRRPQDSAHASRAISWSTKMHQFRTLPTHTNTDTAVRSAKKHGKGTSACRKPTKYFCNLLYGQEERVTSPKPEVRRPSVAGSALQASDRALLWGSLQVRQDAGDGQECEAHRNPGYEGEGSGERSGQGGREETGCTGDKARRRAGSK